MKIMIIKINICQKMSCVCCSTSTWRNKKRFRIKVVGFFFSILEDNCVKVGCLFYDGTICSRGK